MHIYFSLVIIALSILSTISEFDEHFFLKYFYKLNTPSIRNDGYQFYKEVVPQEQFHAYTEEILQEKLIKMQAEEVKQTRQITLQCCKNNSQKYLNAL